MTPAHDRAEGVTARGPLPRMFTQRAFAGTAGATRSGAPGPCGRTRSTGREPRCSGARDTGARAIRLALRQQLFRRNPALLGAPVRRRHRSGDHPREIENAALSTIERLAELQAFVADPARSAADTVHGPNLAADTNQITSRVEGRRIVLVDDVFTTGSTVAECARALKGAGAVEVRVVTVARAMA